MEITYYLHDAFGDYSNSPKVKSFAESVFHTIDTFFNSQRNMLEPIGLSQSYKRAFGSLNTAYSSVMEDKAHQFRTMFITSCKNYNINDCKKKAFNFTPSKQNNFKMSYSKLRELVLMQVTMQLIRNNGVLFDFQVAFAIAYALYAHFQWYAFLADAFGGKQFEYLMSAAEFKCLYKEICEKLTVADLTKYFDILNYKEPVQLFKQYDEPDEIHHIKTKPESLEDLTALRTEEMSQCEWLNAIGEYWGCSLSTARRYVKAFGGEMRKYVKHDIDQAEQRLHSNINESTDRIIAVMREEIAEQKRLILDCNKEKSELLAEIERLKETVNKQNLDNTALLTIIKDQENKINELTTKIFKPEPEQMTANGETKTEKANVKYDLFQ